MRDREIHVRGVDMTTVAQRCVTLLLLTLSACATNAPSFDPPPADMGRTWYWLGTIESGRAVRAIDPERYTLTFQNDLVAIRADCNRGSGEFARDGSRFTVQPLALTRAACVPPTQGAAYAAQLQGTFELRQVGGVLRLESGERTLFFGSDSSARLLAYRCPSGSMLSTVAAGDRLQVWFDGKYWALSKVPAASGVRYGNGKIMFHTKGVLGSLWEGDALLARDCQL